MAGRVRAVKENLSRTNSICNPPELLLLDYVLSNNRESVIRLIEINKKLLNHIYSPEYNKPILLIACAEESVQANMVRTLINLGADLYFSSKIDDNWQALHFAAFSTRTDILRAVIENLKNPDDINTTANGSTALHILIKHGKSEPKDEFVKCARLLIQKGIDVNLADSNGISAILYAAKNGYKDIIKVILEDSSIPVDLDTHQSRRKTARDIIVSNGLYDGPLPAALENNNESDESVLFQHLQNGRENAFINFKSGDIKDLVDISNSSTLLQISCQRRLPKAVEYLLKSGADPNLTTAANRQAPIEIAAEHGYYDIFELLLNNGNTVVPSSILIPLLKAIDNSEHLDVGISYEKCYEILIKKIRTNKALLDINETDASNNSPLHYAVRYGGPKIVEELLELGASLGSKNKFGVMPVQDIEPRVLEKHLDDCVQFQLSKKIDKEDFLVTFDYRTFIPPSKKIEANENCDKNDLESNMNEKETRELVAETEVIAYMSQTSELKHLLTHPTIVSFLFMKWQRISWLFYVNLFFYVIFSSSLVIYIFASYTNPDSSDMSPFVTFLAYTSKAVFFLTFLILVFRELFQMAISPNSYFKNFENYIEIILIFCAGSILCNANILPGEDNSIDDTRKILSAISILLAAFELVLMVGQHPKFSTNVVMLRTVSMNFFNFLMWYSLLIIAFALSFYILFSEGKPASKNETADDQEEDLFADPGKSVFKTIVMLTGEFDASSMNFHHFPITSKIMFSLFIFMIAIILLNLLNGLAVSDTQMIKSNAELMGHITRAQHIRYVESMILGNVLPSKLLGALKNLYCCFPVDGSYTFSIFKPLAQRVCLFPHFLEYQLSVYPNKHGKINLDMKGKKNGESGNCAFGCCHDLYLDKETVKRINDIVHERKKEMKRRQEDIEDSRKFNELYNTMERLLLLVQNLSTKIGKQNIV